MWLFVSEQDAMYFTELLKSIANVKSIASWEINIYLQIFIFILHKYYKENFLYERLRKYCEEKRARESIKQYVLYKLYKQKVIS